MSTDREPRPPIAPIAAVLLVGLLARVLFWVFGAEVLWPDPYRGADTPWYVAAAINLVDQGVYSSDLSFRDGFFFRPPGYSLFWAPFYWALGEGRAYIGVAAVQTLLDTATIALVWTVILRLGGSTTAALVGAVVYSLYPFTIVWITPSLPDAVSNFAVFGLLAMLLTAEGRPWRWGAAGALLAVCVLLREYLGLLGLAVPFIALSSAASVKEAALLCTVLGLSAVAVYSPWPLRNWISYDEPIIFRAANSGSRFYDADARAASAWMSAWTTFPEQYIEKIEDGDGEVGFPPAIFADEKERLSAEHIALRARRCGGSFNAAERHQILGEPCTREVAIGFETLLRSYKTRHPIKYWLNVPFKNLRKVVFKSRLVKSEDGSSLLRSAERLAFLGRTVLLLLGFAGLVVYRRNVPLMGVATSAIAIYLFMAFVFRGLQMRYLLQSDLMMFLPAAMVIGALLLKLGSLLRSR